MHWQSVYGILRWQFVNSHVEVWRRESIGEGDAGFVGVGNNVAANDYDVAEAKETCYHILPFHAWKMYIQVAQFIE